MANFLRFSLISACVTLMCLFDFFDFSQSHATYPPSTGVSPFIVSILRVNESELLCAGTIISNRHVLTAAHCIHKKGSPQRLSRNDIIVFLGAYNRTAYAYNEEEERSVTEIYIHPEWNVMHDDYDADVAILVLSEKITFTEIIQPVTLPADNIHYDGATIDVIGTVVSWDLADNKIREELTVQALNDSYCYRQVYSAVPLSSERTFCAKFETAVTNRRYTGAGYFVNDGSDWVLYGVTSLVGTWYVGDVANKRIAVIANVNSFKEWIVTTVKDTMEIESVHNETILAIPTPDEANDKIKREK